MPLESQACGMHEWVISNLRIGDKVRPFDDLDYAAILALQLVNPAAPV